MAMTMQDVSTVQKAEEIRLTRSLDNMIQQVNDIKASINQFLYKVDHEHETLSWPSVLDSFALLSSQINSFQKLLASDSMASLKTYVFVPINLNQDKDIELEKLTSGRVAAFNHEIVPDYLRTKPELDVEQKIKTCTDKASNLSNDAATKQINSFNKICASLATQIQNKRDEWRNEEGLRRIPESSSRADTLSLVAATVHGKSLIDQRQPPVGMINGLGHQPMRQEMPPHPSMIHPRAPIPTINMGGPARVQHLRPNIRMHPYGFRQGP